MFIRYSSLKYSCYLLLIAVGWSPSLVYAECGNGVVEDGEACDDGNGNNLDLCNTNCEIGLDIPMVTITAQQGEIGSARSRASFPRHKVTLDYNLLVSKTEITHAQYRACYDAGECTEPSTASGCIWNTPQFY